MRSTRGLFGSSALLLALPIAALYEALAGADASVVVHGMLALGSGLLSLAAFDFRAPRWATRLGSGAAGALAAIFTLQALSEWIRHDRLAHFAYQVLGQRLEATLVDGFMGWCVATLLADERTSRVVGAIALAPVVGSRMYALAAAAHGSSFDAQAPMLKALSLLPFAWLAFESAKSARLGATR